MGRGIAYAALCALGALAVSLAWLAYADPAFAACFPRSACQPPPQGAPGPLIGVGLPLAGAALATLLIVRRFRRKE